VQAARIVFPPDDRAEIAEAITGILTTGALTLGPYTQQFEAAFAEAHDADNAIAIASGTAALEISLRAVGAEGRDVIVPANTFYATAAAILRVSARPVFADIDAATFALSPNTITAALTPQTAAVVLVHIAGLVSPPPRGEIKSLCEQRGIITCWRTRRTRTAPPTTASSPGHSGPRLRSPSTTKVVTSGEGGMIVTPSADLAAEARIYRDQGRGRVLGEPPRAARLRLAARRGQCRDRPGAPAGWASSSPPPGGSCPVRQGTGQPGRA
jgi:dTDP-4-amino-4,6-dideoxygalactose transaminase